MINRVMDDKYTTWDYKLNSGITSHAVSVSEMVELYKRKILTNSTLVKPYSSDRWLRLEDSILFPQRYISNLTKAFYLKELLQSLLLNIIRPIAYLYKALRFITEPLEKARTVQEKYTYKGYSYNINFTLSNDQLLVDFYNLSTFFKLVFITAITIFIHFHIIDSFSLPLEILNIAFYFSFLIIFLKSSKRKKIDHIENSLNRQILKVKKSIDDQRDLEIERERIENKEYLRQKKLQEQYEEQQKRKIEQQRIRMQNYLTRTKEDMGANSCCIYVLESIDQDHLPIKLGISNNIDRRVSEHRRHTNINYIPRTIIWMKNKKQAQKVETHLINKLVKSGHPRAGNEFFKVPLKLVNENLFEILNNLIGSNRVS